MRAHFPVQTDQDISLRQAAITAGVGLLVMTIAAPFAEFLVFKRLVIQGDIVVTVENILANSSLYLSGIFAYLVVFIMDVMVAWALYVLLAPVNHAVSLLTAWFRLIYTAIALVSMLKLVTVYRLLQMPDFGELFGPEHRLAQVKVLLNTFRFEWGFSLILFGVHLLLLGWLVYRADFIPRILGILLAIAGLAWLVYEVLPFMVPGVDLGFLFFAFMGETVFMLWLLVRGWKIR